MTSALSSIVSKYVFCLGRECRRQYSCGIVKISFERGRIGALPCSITRPHCRAAAGTEGFTGDAYVFYLGRECRRQYSCGIINAQLSERGRIGASVSSPYPPTPGEKTKNPPLTNNSQGRIDISIRGATLIRTCVRACKIPSYLRQLTRSSRRAILGKRLSFAPSAGHLTTCVLFDSHPSELSVNARSPLLPLQRFIS